jgi:hypothetical protein
VLDWFSRRVLAWRLSITLEEEFCLSCTRFLWTPICPTGERHDEVQHERN